MRTNIVKVTLGRLTTVSKKQLWKEDYGQKIQFIGVDLPYRYEVDFADSPTGQAITMIGDETGVLVPDELLQNEGNIYAYLYLHTGADDGETQYTVILPVEQRAERTDIEPTPVQQNIIEQTIVALNDAVEKTAADVVAADASAQAAAGSAEAAGQAKDDAVEAKGKAEDAQEAAETAQGKAEDAQRAAEQAAGSVLGLTADATVDANVGTPSVDVEVTTESDHKHMEFTFRNLKGVKGDPGDPGVGISSVVLNADYTLTITLTNGVSYTTTSIRGEVGATPNLTIGTISTLPEGSPATATITGTDEEPVLNLGIPVGNTGATGNGIASIAKTGTVGLVDTYTITYTDGTTSTFEVTNGADGEVSEEELTEKLADKADVITSTASGEIVTIADGGDDMLVVDLKLSLLPVQSGSGDPSPDNIRPISGWTGVEVRRTGVNLFGGNDLRDGVLAGVEATDYPDDRYVSFQAAATYRQSFTAYRCRFKKGVRYTIVLTLYSTQGYSNIQVNFTDGTNAAFPNPSSANTKTTIVYTTPAGKSLYYIRKRNSSGSTRIYYDESGIFEGVHTADEFKPYNGNTILIDWTDEAGTVYGCNIDPVSGVLTVDRVLETITDESDITYRANGIFQYQTADYFIKPRLSSINLFLSNYLKPYAVLGYTGLTENYSIGFYNSTDGTRSKIVYFTLDKTMVTSVALAQAYLQNNPITFVYPLDTKVEYQLSPTQIATLLGTNNFWSNGNGVVDLGYRCDTKLYIEQLTKPSEDDMTANANIASDKYFMVGNRLMLSTTAIAQGEQIVVGTNCSEVSLADALNTINS